MVEITREGVLEALKKGVVLDETGPRGGQDVVSAGLIQGLVVKNGRVGFTIEVGPEEGANMEPLRRACEGVVKSLPGVTSVTAVLTAHSESPGDRPPQPGREGQNEARKTRGEAQRGIPSARAIIAVASGKGGVGKSTTAVNLALGLRALGRRVGLLDADIYGPSIPRLLGIREQPKSLAGKKLLPIEKFGLECMSIGFLVEEDRPMIWRGPMVQSALTQMMGDVAWGELDVVVVDMPPGTGDAQLTMAQQVPLTGAVIVSTPQDLALIDARKGLNMFRRVNVPVFGIVQNMSTFVCPHCGQASHIFGEDGAARTARDLGVDLLGDVPLHMSIREASDEGLPVMVSASESPEARAYLEISAKVGAALDAALGGGVLRPPRIVVQ